MSLFFLLLEEEFQHLSRCGQLLLARFYCRRVAVPTILIRTFPQHLVGLTFSHHAETKVIDGEVCLFHHLSISVTSLSAQDLFCLIE